MKLDAFFEAVGPYFEGRIGHATAVHALYGGDGGLDGERLAVYARFCRAHRFEVLALFEETRAAVIAHGGEAAWERLVEDFFVAHPMRHFELFENGAGFPAWLAGEAAGRGLAPWLAELADLEWWRWQVEMGLDPEDDDPGGGSSQGPLRIAASVELRPYANDLCAWLDLEADRPAAPAPGERVVIFWRDRDLDGRSEPASPVELAVLKMVSEEMSLEALQRATGLSRRVIESTVEDLRAAGILDGSR